MDPTHPTHPTHPKDESGASLPRMDIAEELAARGMPVCSFVIGKHMAGRTAVAVELARRLQQQQQQQQQQQGVSKLTVFCFDACTESVHAHADAWRRALPDASDASVVTMTADTIEQSRKVIDNLVDEQMQSTHACADACMHACGTMHVLVLDNVMYALSESAMIRRLIACARCSPHRISVILTAAFPLIVHWPVDLMFVFPDDLPMYERRLARYAAAVGGGTSAAAVGGGTSAAAIGTSAAAWERPFQRLLAHIKRAPATRSIVIWCRATHAHAPACADHPGLLYHDLRQSHMVQTTQKST